MPKLFSALPKNTGVSVPFRKSSHRTVRLPPPTVQRRTTIPVDNTSVNPARSLATAVFQGSWALRQLWLFIVFPIVGGLLGSAGVAVPRTGRNA